LFKEQNPKNRKYTKNLLFIWKKSKTAQKTNFSRKYSFLIKQLKNNTK